MTIIFDDSYKKKLLHPAVDIKDEVLYIGHFLPIKESDITETLCLITSQREAFPTFEDDLKFRNIELKYPDFFGEDRWRATDIGNWIKTGYGFEREILPKILEALHKYLYLETEAEYIFAALWIIGTYLQPVWDGYAYLDIIGIRRTGKTQFILVLEATCFAPVMSGSISGPSLFRTIQSIRPTVLIDEAERLSSPERMGEIRTILLLGYKRAGYAVRSEGEKKKVPRRFETFSPKAIVSVQGLEEYLADRSIRVIMIRAPKESPVNKQVIRKNDEEWWNIRNMLYGFALSNWSKIKSIYQTIEAKDITARDLEIWKPILSLAKYLNVYDKIYELAKIKIKEKEIEDLSETRELLLLKSLGTFVDKDGYYAVSEIRNHLIKTEFEDEEPRGLTGRWVGTALDRLGFKDKRKSHGRWQRYLKRNNVLRAINQYGITLEEYDRYEVPKTPKTPDFDDVTLLRYARDVYEKTSDINRVIKALQENMKASEEKAREIVNKLMDTNDDKNEDN